LRNEKIGFKIREHTLKRVPYMLVVGDKEMASGQVAVRSRRGEDLGSMPIDEFIALASKEVAEKVIK
jgi:threonyl-tRNA synthetase